MNININGKIFSLSKPIGEGGEGEVYQVLVEGVSKCVKIFHVENRTQYVERKVIALINKFSSINYGYSANNIAYPEQVVYDYESGKFCGFIMKSFLNHYRLIDLNYSKNTKTFGNSDLEEEEIIKIIDNLFYKLKVLHRMGLIVGDLNPENILIDKETLTPVLVDIDSFQVGTYYSNSRRKDYFDPKVKINGYGNAKYYIYSTQSDIYALSIIAYDLLVGSKPHFYNTHIPSDSFYKKNINLSFLDFYIDNQVKEIIEGNKIFKDELYYSLIERLYYLESGYYEIIAFFKSVFCQRRRYYFYYKQKREVDIKRNNGIISVQEIELIEQSKEDPEELILFLNQYNFNFI